MSSWKTTAAGIGTMAAAIGVAVTAMFDNDPTTIADWGSVVAAIIAGIGLILARDNNVTSEQAGASTPAGDGTTTDTGSGA